MTVLARAFPGWEDTPELTPEQAAHRLPHQGGALGPSWEHGWNLTRHAAALADLYQGDTSP